MTESKRPNIVMICSDQHSPHVFGPGGDTVVRTPHMNRLAREGVVFDAAYCQAPLCSPSRMSFMTGRYPFRTHVLTNDGIMDSRIPTLGHMLNCAGYDSVLCGRTEFVGYDSYHGFTERLVGDLRPDFTPEDKRFAPLEGDLGNMGIDAPLRTVGAGSTCFIDYDKHVTEEACNWLRDRKQSDEETPFLLWVGMINPHCPYIAPPDLVSHYLPQVDPVTLSPEALNDLHPFHKAYRKKIKLDEIPRENEHRAKAAYYGLVEQVDTWVGDIMTTLEQTQQLEDTVVIYFSDHGEMLGEHGRWHKGCFFEASAAVPMVIRLPKSMRQEGSDEGGRHIDQIVELVDLFPTICDWAGVEIPHEIEGTSLTPLLNGEVDGWDNTARCEYYGDGSSRMIRKDNWKLCFYGNYADSELYDLSADPQEDNDLSGDPSCQKVLRELMDEVFADGWHVDILQDARAYQQQIGLYAMRRAFSGKEGIKPLLPKPLVYWDDMKNAKNFIVE